MSKNKENVPKLRFPGFTKAWEQRKLGKVAEFSKGSGYTKNDLTESGSPIVLYGRLYTKYETVINDVDTFVEMRDKSVISEGNEVVVPSSGETAEDISRASVIGKSGFILGGDLNIIKPNQEINPIFLALTISTGTQQKEISKHAQGKSVVHLYNSDLKQVNLLYPKLEEQNQIGNFFANIDNLITLHQRKLNNVRYLKAGLLQKMFPKNGESFPEVRLPGFTNDWEQRKLGDLVTIKSGMSPSVFELGDELYVKVDDLNYSFREQNDTQMKVTENLRCSKVKKGSVIFPKRGAAIMTNKVRIMGISGYMDTNMMALEPEGISTEFLYLFIGKTGLYKIADTSTIPQINNKHIEPYEIIMPNVDEQQRIGTFFTNLDNLITLHQRKLEHLQEQKKALLQQMFV